MNCVNIELTSFLRVFFFTYDFYIRNKISIYFYFKNLIQFLKNYSCPIDVQLNS